MIMMWHPLPCCIWVMWQGVEKFSAMQHGAWGEYLPFSFLECMAIPEKWSYSAVCPTPGGKLGGGQIEEIIYQETVSDTLSKSIPSYLQPTVISYLMGLGVSEKEAEEFVNALPEKSTTLGEYQVAVDKGKGKIKIYRPY